jgi:hypothetical protein
MKLSRYLVGLLGLILSFSSYHLQKIFLNLDDKVTSSTTKNPAEGSNCTHFPAMPIHPHQKPLWIPSYPGSGAELFRELTMAITSQPTVDGALLGECSKKFVSCKTHWPTLNYTKRFQDPLLKFNQYSPDVVVLLRHPMDAIPSWYNQIHEVRVKNEFHSTQAPESSWNRWIQLRSTLRERMALWKEMILYWLLIDQRARGHYHVSHWVPYEQLVSNITGPEILKRVGGTFKKAGSPVSEDIECLWRYIVVDRRGMKRGHHTYTPLYLQEHKAIFLQELDALLEVIGDLKAFKRKGINAEDRILLNTLLGYRRDIEQNFHLRVNPNATKKSKKLRNNPNL